jgi:hypothetical protein
MIATVKSLNPIRLQVRRLSRTESVYHTQANQTLLASLKVGDRVNVRRVANVPCLVVDSHESVR